MVCSHNGAAAPAAAPAADGKFTASGGGISPANDQNTHRAMVVIDRDLRMSLIESVSQAFDHRIVPAVVLLVVFDNGMGAAVLDNPDVGVNLHGMNP